MQTKTERVTGQELDTLRAALSEWRNMLAQQSEVDIFWPALRHRHNAIVVSASLGIPDLAEVYATKGRP